MRTMDINLIPKRPHAFLRRFTGLYLPVLLCVGVIAAGYMTHQFYQGRIAQSQATLRGLQTQVQLAEMAASKTSAAELYGRGMKQLTAMKENRADWVQVLNTISSQLPSGAMVQQLQLDTTKVTLQGQIPTMADLAGYEQALLRAPWVNSVAVSQLRQQSGGIQSGFALFTASGAAARSATTYQFQMTVILKGTPGGETN